MRCADYAAATAVAALAQLPDNETAMTGKHAFNLSREQARRIYSRMMRRAYNSRPAMSLPQLVEWSTRRARRKR